LRHISQLSCQRRLFALTGIPLRFGEIGDQVQPALSVIIACRNAEDTLAAQLTALSTQVCDAPWDVLVCDNGSTDGTAALARSFQDRIPSLRVINAGARPGAGYARNVGAAATTAPLLAFCDADDEVAPGWIAAMMAGLRRHQFIAGSFDAHRLNLPAVVRSRPLQQAAGLQHSPFGPGLPHAGGGNLGVRRSVFLGAGGFDPEVGCLEDTDLCWRIQLSGVPLVFWPEAVLHVRLRSSLRGMWHQGRAYGAAAAMLDHRYPRPPQTGRRQMTVVRADTRTPPGVALEKLTAPIRKVTSLAREQASLGGFLWTLGWHVGHRRWRPRISAPESAPAALGHRQAG
jgi:Glycosyl transferase family 2